MAAALGGCEAARKKYEADFKTGYVRDFVPSCAKTAVERGAQEPRARAVCACVANRLVERYPVLELTKLSLSPKSDESQKAFKDAATSCRDAKP